MAVPEVPVTIRAYHETDYDEVAALWTRINREFAPADMRELFEQYIATAINSELRQLQTVFSETKRNAFWVVESARRIVGTFGVESRSKDSTELRRMYLDRGHRGSGVAQLMLQYAELRARQFGFSKMILSTAEIQKAAIAFYAKSGFQLVETEVASAMSTKTAGGGLTRYHFEKMPLTQRGPLRVKCDMADRCTCVPYDHGTGQC
jgi:N-acetylglutamate synthase-like GNAT family acetyltransferase